MLTSVLSFQYKAIQRNVTTFLLIVLTALLVLYVGYRHGTLKEAVAYLAVMWLCALFIDLYAIKRPAGNDFVVRNPKRETAWFFVCLVLGLVFFYFRFSGPVPWDKMKPILKLAIIPLIIFVFPIGLAIIMLLMKYKPADLGIRLQGFIVVIPVILLSAVTNRVVSPGSFTWSKVVEESGGVLPAIFSGLIAAGLSEEFFRVIGQTRLGAVFHNKGMGWLITTIIWALLHAPKWYGENHDSVETLLSSARIIPLGLMWGYITHRTKSILPATLVHGTNLWGLQNF